MGSYIPHFVDQGFDTTITQHHSVDFKGEYDRDGPLKNLTTPPNFQGAPDEDLNNPWWLPGIRDIIVELQGTELKVEDLQAIAYELSPIPVG
ncbi:hypothetical protein ACS0TY_011273 [Phlomoides rotata]